MIYSGGEMHHLDYIQEKNNLNVYEDISVGIGVSYAIWLLNC